MVKLQPGVKPSRKPLKASTGFDLKFKAPVAAVKLKHAGLSNPQPPSAAPVQPEVADDSKVKLYDWVRGSYGKKASLKTIEEKGWQMDKELSSTNQSVFWNPRTDHVVMTVAGTHSARDLITDAMVGLGQVKSTGRYKEAKDTHRKATAKYGKVDDVVGASLGGGIASALGASRAGKDSQIHTYNKWSLGTEGTNKKETAYRTPLDPASFFTASKGNTITIGEDKHYKNLLEAHSSSHLKKEQIFVG